MGIINGRQVAGSTMMAGLPGSDEMQETTLFRAWKEHGYLVMEARLRSTRSTTTDYGKDRQNVIMLKFGFKGAVP